MAFKATAYEIAAFEKRFGRGLGVKLGSIQRSGDTIRLEIPWPPSVNGYWRAYRGKIIVSRAGRVYQALCMSVIGCRADEMIRTPIAFDAVLHPPTRAKRDLDNHLKATLDALAKCQIIENDHLIHELSIRWGAVVKGGIVKATLRILT